MAHGTNTVIKRGAEGAQVKPDTKTGPGSRRIFAPQFKIQVLDSYRYDADCKGNQRATARKYNIHRRQIQKWLQMEETLRKGVSGKQQQSTQTVKNEMSLNNHRLPGDIESSDERSAGMAGDAPVSEMETPAGWSAYQFQTYVSDSITPIDLSLKRPITPQQLYNGPPSEPSLSYTIPYEYESASPYLKFSYQPGVWDLSTKNNKRKVENNEDSTSSKTVKLFKPYLDVISEDEDHNSLPASTSSTNSSLSPTIPNYYSSPLRQCTDYCLCCECKLSYPNYFLHDLQQPNNGLSPVYSTYFYPELLHCDAYEDGMVPFTQHQSLSYDTDYKFMTMDHYYSDRTLIC